MKYVQQLKINKSQLITSIFILLCFIGYVFFPTNNYFQYKSAALIFLLILPFLYNKYLLKEASFFKKIIIGDWKNNLKFMVMGLIAPFVIMILFFKYTDLLNHYLLSPSVKGDFKQFLFYELTGVAFTVAVYEIFFRGFVMFYFTSKLQKWAILAQFLFFVVMLFLLNVPYWFYITYLVFAPFSGWIAYKSNSIMYSFLGQLLFVIIFDASFIGLTVK